MTNQITERFDQALDLTKQPKEPDCCLVEAAITVIEWATKERHVLKVLDESITEFGSLYAELEKWWGS